MALKKTTSECPLCRDVVVKGVPPFPWSGGARWNEEEDQLTLDAIRDTIREALEEEEEEEEQEHTAPPLRGIFPTFAFLFFFASIFSRRC